MSKRKKKLTGKKGIEIKEQKKKETKTS